MTIWDDIYKNYQKGGEAWATLSEEIHPLFKEFLNESNFKIKYVLDIGCGTGKYLKFLQDGGFKTDGIDSSETSVEMTKGTLEDDSLIVCANMFEFQIPKEKYDLIIFFFFQAEDGIRDWSVTGVQTCALPIYSFPIRDWSVTGVQTCALPI